VPLFGNPGVASATGALVLPGAPFAYLETAAPKVVGQPADSTPPGGGGGSVTVVGEALGNNASTGTTSSFTITFPAAAAVDDIAVVTVNSLNTTVTLTTPTGWTLSSGPDRASANSGWLLYKVLTSADITAGSVTLAFSAAQQCNAIMEVLRGATATGMLSALATDATSDTNAPSPSIASVPASAWFGLSFVYRIGATPPPDVGLITGYTQGARVASGNGASPEFSVECQYQIPGTAGTYGGETGTLATSGTNQTGLVYAIAFPSSGGGTTTLAVSDTGTAADDVTVTASAPLGDVGTAGDGVTVAVAAALADSATASDAASVSASIPLADTGAAADAVTVKATAPMADAGAATDGLAVTAVVPLADTATGADLLGVGGVPVTLPETATGADTLSVKAAAPLSDAGAAAETFTVLVRVTLTDLATAADAVATTALVGLTDSATANDTVTAAPSVVDNVTHTYVTATLLGNAGTAALATDGTSVAVLAVTPPGLAALLAVPPSLAALSSDGTSTASLNGDGTSTAALANTAALAALQTTT